MIRIIKWLLTLLFLGLLTAACLAAVLFYYFGAGLPDYKQLANYEPPVVTRLYANDGRLFAEYAYEKRIYVPITSIPNQVKQAFISAEDKNFYTHFGLDIPSIMTAGIRNISTLGTSRRPKGASTITQQVAKNFLLADISHAVSIERKVKEAILSFRIEKAYQKDYILELYLNEVYLGGSAHGVAAAALNYFNKSLEELTIAESAFLAALPKAPSRYHPEKTPELTYGRRNWVLKRMLEDGVITQDQYDKGIQEKIKFVERDPATLIRADYFAEEVRRELVNLKGEKSAYQDGYVVRTTLQPHLQKIATETLQEGLVAYDRKHGWRGPVAHLDLNGDEKKPQAQGPWLLRLKNIIRPAGSISWKLAVTLQVAKDKAIVGIIDGSIGIVPLKEMKWARKFISDTSRGPDITQATQVLSEGDVILVSPSPEGQNQFQLNQIPAVSGAIVALDPNTGKVLAMQGGYSYEMSQFNRATQAMRQTGSAFKTFVFLAALEKGLSPTTLVYDAPFSISMGFGQGMWEPHNWDNKFMGEMTMRQSFELSRNVPAIRMIHERVGMKQVANVSKRLHIDEKLPLHLAGVLGACETTVLKMAAAYGMLANGGRLILPTFIDQVQDRRGKKVLINKGSIAVNEASLQDPSSPPLLKDTRPYVTDPVAAYQMTSLLTGVVQRGTGKLLQKLEHPIAVKSGTTNDFKDAWMAGYSPNLAVVVFVGFDTPRTLGHKHFGAVVAGPIFLNFMEKALAHEPVRPFTVPAGTHFVQVDAQTGERAMAGDTNVITEVLASPTHPSFEGDGNGITSGQNTSPIDDDLDNQIPWAVVDNPNQTHEPADTASTNPAQQMREPIATPSGQSPTGLY